MTLSRTVISAAPCDTHTNCLNDGCHLLFIQCPSCAEKFAGCCSEACMEEHKLPEEEQRKLRAGRENGNKIFNKSRGRLNTKLGILDPEPSENHNQTRSMIASSSQSAVDHKMLAHVVDQHIKQATHNRSQSLTASAEAVLPNGKSAAFHYALKRAREKGPD